MSCPKRLVTEQTRSDQLQITEREISFRKSLLMLTEDDVAALLACKPAVATRIDAVVDEFYRYQVEVSEIALGRPLSDQSGSASIGVAATPRAATRTVALHPFVAVAPQDHSAHSDIPRPPAEFGSPDGRRDDRGKLSFALSRSG